MSKYFLGMIGVLAFATQVHAQPPQGPELDNTLRLVVTGENNQIEIVQTEQSGHQADIEISGTNNGRGLTGAWHRDFQPMLQAERLLPGTLIQSGLSQTAQVRIGGQDNLFAAHQSGQSNRLTATIQGRLNNAAVIQAGTGNTASFSQTGQRNSLSIRQSSW
ncbi:hypothetical protein [Pseudoponticoccus marisrubri]|uniref:Curlin-associated protein n=1 Tax=Pseudoponticoccus marisrubri TaxID=1685382 RepID=A0A0W7WLI4_9RHOB|nr:hypothetical protein [Pseudoponticoccus marisrubri]KUF11469.1 hypothetical protein AVJ23_06805 [Pseudoponticoccus marisrubri]